MLYSDSMPAPLSYLDTILEAARESGRSEREISRIATGQAAAISLLKTGRTPSVERVRRLCDALDLEFYIGPRRPQFAPVPHEEGQQIREVREARGPRAYLVDPPPVVEAKREIGPDLSTPGEPQLLDAERQEDVNEPLTVFLPIREVGLHGAEGRLAFRHHWLAQHGINPLQSVVLGVSGESMEPTVPDGSSILVDRSRQARRNGGVYVVQTGGALVVKRAGQDADGKWLLVSDHLGWPDEPWPDDAAVFGEVRWVATLLA